MVIERENVQPFDSWTSWLRIERPARLTVSRTLPAQAWALATADGKLTLPVIVRLMPALMDFLATLTLSLATKRETTTLRESSVVEPALSVTIRRRAWPPTSVPFGEKEHSNGAADSDAQRARAEHDGGGLDAGRRARGEHDLRLARDRARPGDEGRGRRAAAVVALLVVLGSGSGVTVPPTVAVAVAVAAVRRVAVAVGVGAGSSSTSP